MGNPPAKVEVKREADGTLRFARRYFKPRLDPIDFDVAAVLIEDGLENVGKRKAQLAKSFPERQWTDERCDVPDPTVPGEACLLHIPIEDVEAALKRSRWRAYENMKVENAHWMLWTTLRFGFFPQVMSTEGLADFANLTKLGPRGYRDYRQEWRLKNGIGKN
jgi:hypothetical protein